MSSPQLKRLWRSVPLQKLTQGSTLSIRSSIGPNLHVFLQPEWRDSGHVELKQVFSKADGFAKEVELIVRAENDETTSIGRLQSHISLLLREASPAVQPTDASIEEQDVLHHSPKKAIEKVMLDDGTVLPDSEEFAGPKPGVRRTEYSDGVAHIAHSKAVDDPPGTYLTVQVPEKINIACTLESGGSISVSSKIEGDVRLFTDDGDISVSKVRGHVVELATGGPHNTIYVSKLIEAQSLSVRTRGGRLRAKQLHGRSVEIVVEPVQAPSSTPIDVRFQEDADDEGSLVDVGALFMSGSGGASINIGPCRPVRRAVRVKSHHGALEVIAKHVARPSAINNFNDTIYPLVELGGVNGNCEVSISSTQDSSDNSDSDSWTSCSVHFDSVAPDSVSLLSVDQGDVSITLDRKIETDLRLLSTSIDCLPEANNLLADEDDPSLVTQVLSNLPDSSTATESRKRLFIATSSFTARPHSLRRYQTEYEDGWIENTSDEPDSRFDRKVRGDGSPLIGGKIRLDGAAEQALDSFFGHAKTDEQDAPGRPLIAVVATKCITVEPVSWIGAIARRYGLEESGRDLGRTASRRDRTLFEAPEQ